MDKYRVLIVDDHEVFRIGLKLLLKMIGNVKVVGEASNGAEFMELLEKQQFDLVFMDINMPVLDGVEATIRAVKKYPGIKIIALSTFGENELFNKMIYAGVEGFMLKNSGFNEFKKAIEKITAGGNYFSDELLANFTKSSMIQKIKDKLEIPAFSERELEVLRFICKGYSNFQIGDELCISNRTVERHKTNMIHKTNTTNTINLIIYAIKNKLVEDI